jgi:hypothetical protein
MENWMWSRRMPQVKTRTRVNQAVEAAGATSVSKSYSSGPGPELASSRYRNAKASHI